MTYAISAQTLFDGDQFLTDHSVVIENEEVLCVIPSDQVSKDIKCQILTPGILAPGFIDIQVNGGGGVMLNNAPCRESVDSISAGHLPTGTTGMLPTLISDSEEVQRAGVEAVRLARANGNRSILGIHLEGPFLELEKRGTHKASMIRKMSTADIDWLSSLKDLPVLLTLAPEHVEARDIAKLSAVGIHVFAGHTNASYEAVKEAVAAGLKGFTHLFNAMSPQTARAPGTVGAALDLDDTWAGIIADGHHVDPAAIRIAFKLKPPGKLLLVTDAMATVGSETSFFELYGERIHEHEGKLINAEGALAGSAIGMIDAVRIATQAAGIPLEESLRMAALYPAKLLKLDKQLGRIEPGYRPDFVHFDQAFKVRGTWVAGQYQAH